MSRKTFYNRRIRLKARKKRKQLRTNIMKGVILAGALLLVSGITVIAARHFLPPDTQAASNPLTLDDEGNQEAPKPASEVTVTLRTAGDIIIHKPFLTSPLYYDQETQTYDYNSIFKYCREDYEEADLTVTGVEGALTGENYSGYPLFHTPDAIIDALKANGADMCLIANNHIYDAGDSGFLRTTEVLRNKGMLYTGGRTSTSEKKYTVQDINGLKVGIMDYVYETQPVDGHKTINGISMSSTGEELLNTFSEQDLESFYQEAKDNIDAMRSEGAEYILAYMHWGIEYQTQESQVQREIAQKLCDLGVNALIGSHPHVIQPVDLFTSSDGSHQMPCAFAIGNHLSNQRRQYIDQRPDGYTEDGVMVTLSLTRNADGEVSLTKMDFVPTWVYYSQANGSEYYVLPLDHPETIETETGLPGISSSVQESIARTNGIIGEGVEKIQNALPIR